MDNNYIASILDEKTQSRQLQILKTALPYMNTRLQKEFVTLIKSIELKKSLDLLEGDDVSLSICSTDNPMENTLNMLTDIRKFCTSAEQEQIDLLLNVFTMMSAYNPLTAAANAS